MDTRDIPIVSDGSMPRDEIEIRQGRHRLVTVKLCGCMKFDDGWKKCPAHELFSSHEKPT